MRTAKHKSCLLTQNKNFENVFLNEEVIISFFSIYFNHSVLITTENQLFLSCDQLVSENGS